ncbi:pyridoxal phosphate-dependent aminotransferase [Chitinivibrio alkaliphilus]|uniref:Aminotransferase n=1 Tax=Chitinivibrio alkaliphilus ACht1 TaxID=1313304 RepID=U7D5R8_9BACT|nr:pyridoxal phosphate-dependent aminotransferase [Chitinivibrio alkaliphilus]ERP30896.1 aspartate aminotransferase [Chitinivibrio alkaliphilus ACht1]
MSRLSKRGVSVVQSPIRAMSTACRKAGGINLAQGVCDTETPSCIIQGAEDALRSGKNSYTNHRGIAELRHAIAEKERREKGLTLDPHKEIVVSNGATGAMYATLSALISPGDEVIVFEPSYGYHTATLQALEAEVRHVQLPLYEDTMPWEELENLVSERTKALIINTPANPAGKVFSSDDFMRIAAIIAPYETVLISDEIYEYFLYEEVPHCSPCMIPALQDRTVVIGGFSKTFSVTGWRVGYLIGPADIASAAGHLNDLYYVCPPAPLQHGICRGLTELTPSFYTALRQNHQEKRDILFTALEKAGLCPTLPKGAYYILADISRIHGSTSLDRAMEFLRRTGVAGVPGSAFYHDSTGDHLCRFCFSKDREIIVEAAQRIEQAFA